MNLEGMRKALATLDEDALRTVNSMVIDAIRAVHRRQAQGAMSTLRIGQIVWFYTTKRGGGKVRMRNTRMNEKSVSGKAHNADGTDGHTTWRASPSLLHTA